MASRTITALHRKEEEALRRALVRYHFNVGAYNRDDMKRDRQTYSTHRLLLEAAGAVLA